MRPSSAAPATSKVVGVGFVVLIILILFIYAPTQKMGFRFVDDYTYLYWAGTLSLPEYLAHSFDPRVQNLYYRPFKRTLVLFEYHLFHDNASAYHLVQNLIHSLNAIFVLGIVWQLVKRWRLAFLAALLYAIMPIACEAVFWIADGTPLATLFSLVALFFWQGWCKVS